MLYPSDPTIALSRSLEFRRYSRVAVFIAFVSKHAQRNNICRRRLDKASPLFICKARYVEAAVPFDMSGKNNGERIVPGPLPLAGIKVIGDRKPYNLKPLTSKQMDHLIEKTKVTVRKSKYNIL